MGYRCLSGVLCTSSPRTSALLSCGDPEVEGGEGGARVGVRCPGSGSPMAEVEGTAGEATEVGRFWKYCSPGSSSSSAPHGYTCGRVVAGFHITEQHLGPFYNQAHSSWLLLHGCGTMCEY